MFSQVPFLSRQIIKLTTFGLNPQYIKNNITTISSQNYIASLDDNHINILDFTKMNNNITNKNIKLIKLKRQYEDAALMHPTKSMIALRSQFQQGHLLKIIDIHTHTVFKNILFENEIITYWKWVNSQILVIITKTSVYHIDNSTTQSNLNKVFDLSQQLYQTQIIGYDLSSDNNWAAINAIYTLDNGITINGRIQLYFIAGHKQQIIQGHACGFGRGYVHNQTHKSQLFCFVQKQSSNKSFYVNISEISPLPNGYQKHKLRTQLVLDQSLSTNDFPISLNVSQKYGALYITTKMGCVHIYQLITNKFIYKTRISSQSVFAVAKNYKDDEILVINKLGVVISGGIFQQKYLPYLIKYCSGHITNAKQLAETIGKRYKSLLWSNNNKKLQQNNHYDLLGGFNDLNINYKGYESNKITIEKPKSYNQTTNKVYQNNQTTNKMYQNKKIYNQYQNNQENYLDNNEQDDDQYNSQDDSEDIDNYDNEHQLPKNIMKMLQIFENQSDEDQDIHKPKHKNNQQSTKTNYQQHKYQQQKIKPNKPSNQPKPQINSTNSNHNNNHFNTKVAEPKLKQKSHPINTEKLIINVQNIDTRTQIQNMSENQAINLVKSINKFPNLTSFDLQNKSITDQGIQVFAENGLKYPKLEQMILGKNKITDQGLKALISHANKLQGLKRIYLNENQITDMGMKMLAVNGAKFPYLRYLDLSRNQITDQGLQSFGANGSKFQSLKVINFDRNEITDIGFESLCLYGSKFRQLDDISLNGNQITDNGLRSLIYYGKNFPKLRYVSLQNNEITAQGEKQLYYSKLQLQVTLGINPNAGWS